MPIENRLQLQLLLIRNGFLKLMELAECDGARYPGPVCAIWPLAASETVAGARQGGYARETGIVSWTGAVCRWRRCGAISRSPAPEPLGRTGRGLLRFGDADCLQQGPGQLPRLGRGEVVGVGMGADRAGGGEPDSGRVLPAV